jgi:anti-sigma B factor antagonist
MQATQVKLNVRKVSDVASVIDISGEITGAAESALTEAYTQASGEFTRVIILNFGDLAYMNSSGIGLLVTMLIRANRQKQKLCAYGLNDHYKQILMLTRLNEAIKIYESEKDALASA